MGERVAELHDPFLSIEEAAGLTPWSASTLYRVAREEEEGSPFRKKAGRWVTSESRLHKWLEAGEKPQRRRGESPMPRPRSARRGSVLATVHELRRSA